MKLTMTNDVPSPAGLIERAARLDGSRLRERRLLASLEAERAGIESELRLAPAVGARIDGLTRRLFDDVLRAVEDQLSHAIRAVLGQDRRVIARRTHRRGRLAVDFSIAQGEREEDILRGQGGSVCNILSIGLRLVALAQLPPEQHRRFIVLDEQDCWLQPELVPRLMHIVREVATRLDFQVLVISHHDIERFRDYADRAYRLLPAKDGHGATVELLFDRERSAGDPPAHP